MACDKINYAALLDKRNSVILENIYIDILNYPCVLNEVLTS